MSETEKWDRTSSYGDGLRSIAIELGLGTVVDKDLGQGHEQVLLNSTRYPDHSFKIGYYRSSYFGGFNSVMHAAVGKDLYWIFEPKEEELKLDCMIQVDWERAHYRAKLFLAELTEAFEKGVQDIHAESDYWNIQLGNDPKTLGHTSNEWYL